MGFKKYTPKDPKSIEWLIDRASNKGLDGVQLADNLFPEQLSDHRCLEISTYAIDRGIEIQWGFDGWDRRKIDRMIELCKISGSTLLRGVFGPDFVSRQSDDQGVLAACLGEIEALIPSLTDGGIILALENHFDLPVRLLYQLVESCGLPSVRICTDTTNAIGQIWKPEEVVKYLSPLSVAIHFKDFKINKVIGGYEIMGVSIGAGDQNCYEILVHALRTNPEMEVCIELGTPWPAGDPPFVDIEIDQVDNSIDTTLSLVRRFYEENSK